MKYPWIPVVTAFASGILLLSVPSQSEIFFSATALLLIAAAYTLHLFNKNSISFYLAVATFFIFGGILKSRHIDFASAEHISHLIASTEIKKNQPLEIFGTTSSHPERGADHLLLYVDIHRVSQKRKTIACSGRVRLYIKLSQEWEDTFFRCPQESKIRFISTLKDPPDFNNPGCFNFPEFLKTEQVLYTTSINSPMALEIIPDNSLSPARAFSTLRSSLEETVFRHFSDADGLNEKGVFINALILGNRGYLDDETIKPLRRAGLMHITAISGFHIWIIGVLTFFLLRLCRLDHRWVIVATVLMMLFYWSVSGGRSSTTRAVIIAVVYLVSKLIARKTWLGNNLALAAFVILLFNPLDIFNPGFQLTFAAVISISICYQPIKKNLSLLKFLAPPLAASIAAQIGVLPLVAWHFNIVNLHSALSSLVIAPFAAAAIFFSFLFLIAGQFIPIINSLLVHLMSLTYGVFLEVADFTHSAFQTSLRLPSPPILLILIYYLMVAAWLLAEIKVREKNDYLSRGLYAAGLAALVAAVSMIIINPTAQPAEGKYVLHAIDVGQADSWFLQTPKGKGILIDGGGSPVGDFDIGEHVVSPALWHLGFRRIEAILATHADADHMEGLLSVISNFQVGEIWLHLPREKPLLLKKLLLIAKKRNIPVNLVTEGVVKHVDDVTIKFLSPPQEGFAGKHSANNNSTIARISFSQGSVLVTGDAELPAIKKVWRTHPLQLKSDVLLLPHHGSSDALFPPFISSVAPKVALVGVGRNNIFGFPHPLVKKELGRQNIPLLQTDKLGMISLEFRPDGITAHTGRKRKRADIPGLRNRLLNSKENVITQR